MNDAAGGRRRPRNLNWALRPAAHLGIFAGGSLLAMAYWLPLWLIGHWPAFWRGALIGLILSLLPLSYGLHRDRRQRHSRLGRLYLGPWPWRAIPIAAPLMTGLLILFQTGQIRRNPNLNLTQYWREEIWLLWLLMLGASLTLLAAQALWQRLWLRN